MSLLNHTWERARDLFFSGTQQKFSWISAAKRETVGYVRPVLTKTPRCSSDCHVGDATGTAFHAKGSLPRRLPARAHHYDDCLRGRTTTTTEPRLLPTECSVGRSLGSVEKRPGIRGAPSTTGLLDVSDVTPRAPCGPHRQHDADLVSGGAWFVSLGLVPDLARPPYFGTEHSRKKWRTHPRPLDSRSFYIPNRWSLKKNPILLCKIFTFISI